jgi:hypothetical protein
MTKYRSRGVATIGQSDGMSGIGLSGRAAYPDECSHLGDFWENSGHLDLIAPRPVMSQSGHGPELA